MVDRRTQEEFAGSISGNGFKELLSRIWATRNLVGIVVLLSALFLVGVLAFQRAAYPALYTYQHAISLNFAGITKREYPNGARFSLGDLTSTEILGKVYRDNKLSEHGIKLNEFISSISISPFSSIYNQTIQRFRKKLENRKLTYTERTVIEEQLEKELSRLGRSNAIVKMISDKRLKIPDELGLKIVSDIPKSWAKISIDRRGVLKLPDTFGKIELINTRIAAGLDFPSIIDLFLTSVNRLKFRLDELAELDGSSTISDEETGHTLLSLQQEIMNFEEYRLRTFSGLVFGLAMTREPVATRLFFDRRLTMLNLRKQSLEKEVDSLLASLKAYAQSSVTKGAIGSTASFGANSISQINNDFIDQIISLSNKSNSEFFRREIITKNIALQKKVISIEQEIATVTSLKLNLKLSESKKENISEITTSRKKKVPEMQISLTSDLNGYWKTLSRLYNELSANRYSYSSHLYSDLNVDNAIVASNAIFSRQVLMLFLALMIAAAIAAMFAGLVWQLITSERKDSKVT